MKKTILIFRHGETDWNLQGRMQGGVDIELNETGRKQALVLKEFFSRFPVEVCLSSDLKRAIETAQIAVGTNQTPIIIEPLLRETNLGAVEGLTKEQVRQQFGEASWEAWATSHPDHGRFRFPGGETKQEHLQRLIRGLEKFLLTTPHTRIAVSTHGGAMRRLIHHFRPELTEPVMVANCTVYELLFKLNENGQPEWELDLEAKCRC
jgi:broad specificity phosphatase PhoE